jgi:hypothetical protein
MTKEAIAVGVAAVGAMLLYASREQSREFEAVETAEELEWIESHLDPDNDYRPYLAYYTGSRVGPLGKPYKMKLGYNAIVNRKFKEQFGRPSNWQRNAQYAFMLADEVEQEYEQSGRSPWGFLNWAELRERLDEDGKDSHMWNILCQILDIRYPELTMGRTTKGVGRKTRWHDYMETQNVPYSPALKSQLSTQIHAKFNPNQIRPQPIAPEWLHKNTFLNDMMLLYVAQEGRCAVTGHLFPDTSYPQPILVEEEVTGYIPTYKDPWKAPSIDRIDNKHGYQPDNVRLVSRGIQYALNQFPDVSLIDMGVRGCTPKELHTFIQPDGDMMNLLVPNANQYKLYLDPEGPYGYTLPEEAL